MGLLESSEVRELLLERGSMPARDELDLSPVVLVNLERRLNAARYLVEDWLNVVDGRQREQDLLRIDPLDVSAGLAPTRRSGPPEAEGNDGGRGYSQRDQHVGQGGCPHGRSVAWRTDRS